MQDEHPPVGQGKGKLCLRQATVCDSAFRSGYFRLYVSLLWGNHKRNITLASKMSYSTTNFAKGSHDKLYFLRLWPTDSSTPAPWRLHTKPYKMLKTSSFRSFFQGPGENCGLILLAGWLDCPQGFSLLPPHDLRDQCRGDAGGFSQPCVPLSHTLPGLRGHPRVFRSGTTGGTAPMLRRNSGGNRRPPLVARRRPDLGLWVTGRVVYRLAAGSLERLCRFLDMVGCAGCRR